jgi:P pilus assembly chaperone PapD
MTHRKKTLLATAAAVLVLISVGSGTAFAYFTATGSGAAAASTGTMLTVTVAATTGTPSTMLYPGGNGDVALQVTNPNSFAVTLVSVTGSGTITGSGGCSPGSTVTFTTQTGLSVPIAASSTTQVHLANAAAMTTAAPSACQGATFTIPVTIVVQK